MEQKILKVDDVIEFNGKKYRAESEAKSGSCRGYAFEDAPSCPIQEGCSTNSVILKEVKETPRRHIELGVVKVEGGRVTFKIVEQTHRCGDFSQQSGHQYFKASNGTELASRAFPEWKGNYPLSCRGCFCGEDDKELTCTAAEFALISEAVNEYNSTDGKGYEKSWPQNGDGYFYIASRGRIEYTEFTDEPFDTDCKAYGNFFRTEEEAMSAAEKVKALFKELAGRVK